MKQMLLAVALFSLSQFAFSKPLELTKCDDVGANIENMLFGKESQKSYYNGNVGLVVFDTIEPAAASYGIAIVHNEPAENPEGFITRKCLAVPFLSAVDLKNAKSTYNARTGVTVVIKARKMDGFTGDARIAKIVINIKSVNTGTISEGHVVTAEEL